MFGRRLRTATLRERRRKIIIDRIALALAFVGALILLFSQLSMIRTTLISEIEIKGNEVITDKELEEIADEYVSGYYFGLFDRSNIFIYSRKKIENEIVAKFPRVKEIDVDFENFNKISINVLERESVGVWCNSDESRCFFLDETGFVFAKAPQFSHSPFFVYQGLLGDDKDLIGKKFLNRDDFSELQSFIEDLQDINVSIVGFKFERVDSYELFLDGGGRIIFDPNDGYDVIRENLALALASDDLRREEDRRIVEIDYIDLRFGNKIFYKLE